MKRTILFIALVILVGNQYSTAQNQVTHFDGTNDMINLGGDAGNEIKLFRNDMPPGVYSYIIKAGINKQYSGKLIFN